MKCLDYIIDLRTFSSENCPKVFGEVAIRKNNTQRITNLEAYLRPNQASVMELFCKYNKRHLAINYFC